MRKINPNQLIKRGDIQHDVTKIKHITSDPMDLYDYCLDVDNDKNVDQYISNIERIVRTSLEYKEMLTVLKEDYGFNQCMFWENVSSEKDPNEPFKKTPRIEIHHEPFSLYDIVNVVLLKRISRQEACRPLEVAEEVLYLHAKGLIGLVPLSVTIHKLVHNSQLFIGMDYVSGRPDLFYKLYLPYIPVSLRQLYDSNLIRSSQIDNEVMRDLDILQPHYLELDDKNNQLTDDYELPIKNE